MVSKPVLLATVVGLGLLVGCGETTSVSGKVTFNGEPVAKGSISFQPADGKGPSAGGEIVDGNYQVTDLEPGPKRVQIVGVKQQASIPKTTGEVASQSNQPQVSQTIPDNAEGNNTEFTVSPGAQTKDFVLTSK